MHYWYKYKEKEDVPDMEIPVDMCLELLVAADFLGIDSQLPFSVSSVVILANPASEHQ